MIEAATNSGSESRSIRCRREARGEGAARHKSPGARRAPASCRMAELPRPRGLQTARAASQWAKRARPHGEAHGCPHEPLPRGLCPLAARPGGLLGRGRRRHRLDRAGEEGVRSQRRRLRPLVRRRRLQHLLERGRPPRDGGPRRAAGDHLRFPAHADETRHHLRPAIAETQVLAGMLQDFGVEKGDRVILYMPMVPEAAIAMLACARIGAVHSVVFGGFAAKELATRIDDAKPKVILSASCGIEPGRVVPTSRCSTRRSSWRAHKPEACLILQRPQAEAAMVAGRDHDWASLREKARVWAKSAYDCVPVAATDPLYILYTSGTTGIAQGRGARQRRPHGRAEMVDEEPLRRRARRGASGRPPTSAGWSATATSSTRRCSTAAPRSSTRASRWARPMPARSGG